MHTILVPIRYPLTEQSAQTLEFAVDSANAHDSAQLLVLHVDLLHQGKRVRTDEIKQAIEPIIGSTAAAVLVQRGFLLEDVILDEVRHNDVDEIIIGKNQQSSWRRLFNRLTGRNPAIASALQDQTTNPIKVVE